MADVIDSDSWRLWPSGDKRLMVDKQVYRNLTSVTSSDLDTVKRNFQWVAEQLEHLTPARPHTVAVLMGSPSDMEHCQKIQSCECTPPLHAISRRPLSYHRTLDACLLQIAASWACTRSCA